MFVFEILSRIDEISYFGGNPTNKDQYEASKFDFIGV